MKKIVFLSWTRADFWKIKSLLWILHNSWDFESHIFVTGMHMNPKYGKTIWEIYKCWYDNIYGYENHDPDTITSTEQLLASTIVWFSEYIHRISPDLIVVHWDRPETLAGAIVWSCNNILVAHIEWGELSWTLDESIRHAVTKLSHIHFVTNDVSQKRLMQMGEMETSIFVIGSPDIDIVMSPSLPALSQVQDYYDISYEKFSIALFHPVTTESHLFQKYSENFVQALILSQKNYIVIFPNNDQGNQYIFENYEKLHSNNSFHILPSIRFEYFLTLLKNAEYIIGNSSSGIFEAPYYWVPAINIGTRQQHRFHTNNIIHTGYEVHEILAGIANISQKMPISMPFGEGNSSTLFLETLSNDAMWQIPKQKSFSHF